MKWIPTYFRRTLRLICSLYLPLGVNVLLLVLWIYVRPYNFSSKIKNIHQSPKSGISSLANTYRKPPMGMKTESRLWSLRNIQKAAFDPKATFRKPPMTSRYRYLHLDRFSDNQRGMNTGKIWPVIKKRTMRRFRVRVQRGLNFIDHKKPRETHVTIPCSKREHGFFFLNVKIFENCTTG